MWLKRGAILLVMLLASITVLTLMAAAGVIHCHDLDQTHHGLESGPPQTDKIFTLDGNVPSIIPENQIFYPQMQFTTPKYLFVAEIFQPPRP
jgi:hypothetical protein